MVVTLGAYLLSAGLAGWAWGLGDRAAGFAAFAFTIGLWVVQVAERSLRDEP